MAGKTVKLYRVADDGWNLDRPLLWELEAEETANQYRTPRHHTTSHTTRLGKAQAIEMGFRPDPEAAVGVAVALAEERVRAANKAFNEAEAELARLQALADSDFRAQIVRVGREEG